MHQAFDGTTTKREPQSGQRRLPPRRLKEVPVLRRIAAAVIVTTALLISACSADNGPASPSRAAASPGASTAAATFARAHGEAADLTGLRAALDGAGLRVGEYRRHKLGGLVSVFPGLRRYDILAVGQGALNVFRFATPGDAARAGSRVDVYGGLPTVEFKDVPHFFRQGRTIVLYVEQDLPVDSTVIRVLRTRLGDQLMGER